MMSNRVLSASIFSNYYCSGAHPDFDDSPINLDIATGDELQLIDVLWLGKGKAELPVDADGRRKNYNYETEVQGRWLAKTMAKLYPKQVAGDVLSTQIGCSYEDKEVWQSATWHLTAQGLYIGATFPSPARVCNYPQWSILPWRIVNKHPGRLRRIWP